MTTNKSLGLVICDETLFSRTIQLLERLVNKVPRAQPASLELKLAFEKGLWPLDLSIRESLLESLNFRRFTKF